jgi:hypothetical protein
MFKDRTLVWVLEYIFGGTLVVVPLMSLVFCRGAPTNAHIWTVWLFVACLGVILISCASSMRQRMLLARRIDILAKQIAGSSGSSDQHDENRQGPPF